MISKKWPGTATGSTYRPESVPREVFASSFPWQCPLSTVSRAVIPGRLPKPPGRESISLSTVGIKPTMPEAVNATWFFVVKSPRAHYRWL